MILIWENDETLSCAIFDEESGKNSGVVKSVAGRAKNNFGTDEYCGWETLFFRMLQFWKEVNDLKW